MTLRHSPPQADTGGPASEQAEPPTVDSRPAAAITVFVVALAALAIVFGVSVFYTLPSNLLSSKDGGGLRTVFNEVLPQNWAFFTKDAQSENILVYHASEGSGFVSGVTTPQGRPSNAFGLSRTQRAQGPELANLQLAIPPEKWTACDGEPARCIELNQDSPAISVANTSPVPTVCGDAYLVIATPVPWAFRDLVPYTLRASTLVRIDAQC